jgi:hypothetical protein
VKQAQKNAIAGGGGWRYELDKIVSPGILSVIRRLLRMSPKFNLIRVLDYNSSCTLWFM